MVELLVAKQDLVNVTVYLDFLDQIVKLQMLVLMVQMDNSVRMEANQLEQQVIVAAHVHQLILETTVRLLLLVLWDQIKLLVKTLELQQALFLQMIAHANVSMAILEKFVKIHLVVQLGQMVNLVLMMVHQQEHKETVDVNVLELGKVLIVNKQLLVKQVPTIYHAKIKVLQLVIFLQDAHAVAQANFLEIIARLQ
jgi:hypothetical protein